MTPLRVLFVINGLGTGGAERSLSEMLPGLAARGVQARIVCLYPRQEGVEAEVRRQGVALDVLAGRFPTRLRRLRRLIAEERPDLIHTTIFEANLTGGLAAARTGLPVLMSLVNTPYDRARLLDPHVRPLSLLMARTADAWTSRRLARHFHAITQTVKTAAVRTLGIPPEDITVVERGRSPERLGAPGEERRRQVRRRLGIASEEQVLITVGRQEFQKGHAYLLRALQLLLPVRPRLRLLVAGRPGHATAELERLRAAPEFKDHVWFLGHREDVPDLLAAADLFVFPSLWEGLGGAVIEAMALGLPLVASDIPALREVLEVDRNATLVPPGSPRELAGAITALLDDQGRAKAFGARSRQIFEARFTLVRCTERMAALYERVAAMTAAARTPRGVPSPAN